MHSIYVFSPLQNSAKVYCQLDLSSAFICVLWVLIYSPLLTDQQVSGGLFVADFVVLREKVFICKPDMLLGVGSCTTSGATPWSVRGPWCVAHLKDTLTLYCIWNISVQNFMPRNHFKSISQLPSSTANWLSFTSCIFKLTIVRTVIWLDVPTQFRGNSTTLYIRKNPTLPGPRRPMKHT